MTDLERGLMSRRTLIRSAMSVGVLAATAPILAACNRGGDTAAGSSGAPTSFSDANDPRGKGYQMIDSFYTLDNDYFQGWAKGSEAAAAILGMTRSQQVDNSNVDTLKSVFESRGHIQHRWHQHAAEYRRRVARDYWHRAERWDLRVE